jgi:hypothetical protein
MVGAARFELATSCAQGRRASQATLRPDNARMIAGICRQARTHLRIRFSSEYDDPEVLSATN